MPQWLRLLDATEAALDELSLADLRRRAAEAGIAGRSKMARSEMESAVMAAQPGARELAWMELAPPLEEIEVLTNVDVHMLALTVDRYVSFIALRRAVAELGETYETTGRYGLQVKRRAEVEIAQSLWEQTVKGLIEFGMTPASRTKVEVKPRGGEEHAVDGLRGRRPASG